MLFPSATITTVSIALTRSLTRIVKTSAAPNRLGTTSATNPNR